MKIERDNIFRNIPEQLPDELFECLVGRNNLKIERIVSRGHTTEEDAWFDQQWHEWVLLLQGEAILRYESGAVLKMSVGDYVHIPAHCRHRVEWTPPAIDTVWLAIHYAP